MSKHEALVVEIKLEPILESHSLSKVKIWDYCVVARTNDWIGKTRAVYIEPDVLVNTSQERFSFLSQDARYNRDSFKEPNGIYARIKAKKFLKGLVQSYGLLAPTSEETPIGTNVWDEWELGWYEPCVQETQNSTKSDEIKMFHHGENSKTPDTPFQIPQYDVEKVMRYGRKVFTEGEPVWVSLKYHGSNWRAVYHNEKMYVGSHYTWKNKVATKPVINHAGVIAKYGEEIGAERIKELEAKFDNWNPPVSEFWRGLDFSIEQFCVDNPGVVVYGELIGGVSGFPYGCKPGELKVMVFDLLKEGKFLDCREARELGNTLNWVHNFYEDKPFNMEEMIHFVEHLPLTANLGGKKIEEGIIIRTSQERYNDCTGRSILKLITPEYSSMKGT
jgi:hypothetical protein